ncbi:GGDEF domain-containing protein [Thiorhodococcus minor]|uniref:Diguanylate cyclase n=1 Tax=Thiorhodococcus minor TaxID=57489 RepID=A0A6M0JXC7_9GAMM|nr:diguanylate cyclase [Thiorhodococcus minor]NEV62196.1 diguanylate cyclase [Thiorhodococcus minor]
MSLQPRSAQDSSRPPAKGSAAGARGSSEPANALTERIRAERIALVYHNTRPALAGNILAALLAVLIILQRTPGVITAAWLTVMLAIAAARWLLKLARDRQAPERPLPPSVWARRLLVVVTINGFCWGVLGILLVGYASPLQTGFAPFIIGGMMAAAVATIGALRSLYLGFTLPMMACLIGAFVWRADPDSLIMAGFAIAFEITMLATAWQVSEIVNRDIQLKLENEGLVRSLTASNAQLGRSNRTLQREIEERRRAVARSEFLATHDALTGLPNRRLQKDRFDQMIARSGGTAAVLFIDLDKFKEVNDSMGHGAGDLLLRAVGIRLLDSLRHADSVCRHGGDEFLLLVGDAADHLTVAGVAARVIHALQEPIEIEGQAIKIGCSIGISLYPDDGEDFEHLVCRADKALYRAKRQGRGKYRFFTHDLDSTDSDARAAREAS